MTRKILFNYLSAFSFILFCISCNNVIEPKHDNIYDPQNPGGTKLAPQIINVVSDNEDNFTFYWHYPTTNIEGYVIERKINNENFQEIFKGPKNSHYYKENPNKSNIYNYRISAYYKEYSSAYSNLLTLAYKDEELYKLNIKHTSYYQYAGNLLTFSPDFDLGATVTDKINIIKPRLALTIVKQLPIDSGLPPSAIAFNEDGIYFIEISSRSIVKIWNTKKWYLFKEFQLEKNYKLIKMINNDYLVCAGIDNFIDIYSLQTDSLVHSFSHDNIATSIVYNKISNTLISSGKDGKIIIWSLTNFEKLLETVINNEVSFISLDTDNYKIISVSGNKIILFNYNDLSMDFIYQRTSPEKILQAFYEKNSNRIVFNTENNVWLLNISEQSEDNMLTLPTQYKYMFADKSFRQFFIGGYPLLGFEINYLKGYWDSNL